MCFINFKTFKTIFHPFPCDMMKASPMFPRFSAFWKKNLKPNDLDPICALPLILIDFQVFLA
jgi:hypothetical protein